MSTLTESLKELALGSGFADVGITSPENVKDLFYGWVGKIRKLKSPKEALESVRSVIVMTQRIWDDSFNLSVYPEDWQGYGMHSDDEHFETYYLGYEVMRKKAQFIVDYLRGRGFEALISFEIPCKTTAVRCGLGAQGKSTLLVTADYGPRVMLVAVLTSAELNVDKPFEEDLCKDCEKCIKACPTKALQPYNLTIQRCMTYSAESPRSPDVPADVRELERKLVRRPTKNSFIDCSICLNVCPIGRRQGA
ncbi:MAG: 4Fe-4S double cluster binding domain-containing protein [Candidatus Thorarchaeota archaeon]|jgi:epoxyqueuosine reductase